MRPYALNGRVHVQTSCLKPRFWNLDFERKKLFNRLDYIMETCIYLNNYLWWNFKTFELLYGGIINNFFSQNLGFGLEHELDQRCLWLQYFFLHRRQVFDNHSQWNEWMMLSQMYRYPEKKFWSSQSVDDVLKDVTGRWENVCLPPQVESYNYPSSWILFSQVYRVVHKTCDYHSQWMMIW